MSEGNGHKKRGRPKGKGNISRERKAEMVAALPLADGCKSEVARQFGVDEAVVRRAAADPQISEMAEVKKEEIARKLGLLVDKLASRFLDIAGDATLDNKASTLLGIAADKHRLYTGEPTSITENRNDASMRESALQTLAEVTAHFNGDESAARNWMANETPTLSRYIN